MIIGYSLGQVFSNMNVAGVNVQYTYGNKDALDKFIERSDKLTTNAFPLIFYVINPVRELNNFKYCDTDLIIMDTRKGKTDTELSNAKTEDSYIKYIEPIYQEIVKRMRLEALDIADKIDKFSYEDIPNYGLTNGKPPNSKSTKSAITYHVDARVIKLKIKINTNCYLKTQ